MRVLTVYAHPDPRSFCHAVLDRFTAGLREAGHDVEIVDLVKDVEHVYFYEVAIADEPRLQEYLRRSYELGRNFAVAAEVAG